MLAEQVIDFTEQHLALRLSAAVAELLEEQERPCHHAPALRHRPEIRRDVPEEPQAMCLILFVARVLEEPARLFGVAPRVVEPACEPQRLSPVALVHGRARALEDGGLAGAR